MDLTPNEMDPFGLEKPRRGEGGLSVPKYKAMAMSIAGFKANISGNLNLDIWQKIYCNEFDIPAKQMQGHLMKKMQELSALANNPEYFKIQVENNPSLEAKFRDEIAALRAQGRGHDADLLEKNKTEGMQELAERYGTAQYQQYKHIVENEVHGERDEIVVLMLNETLGTIYNKDHGVEKRVPNKSVEGHMVINPIVLTAIKDNIEKFSKFAEVYRLSLDILADKVKEGGKTSIEGVETFGKGDWIQFLSKVKDPENFARSVQDLTAICEKSTWCTRYNAEGQLSHGDFFVFVDNNGNPRLAVKTTGNRIDEVRGVLNWEKGDNGQEIEPEYLNVAESFLTGNKEIEGGKEWLDDTQLNKRFIEWNRKINDGTLSAEEVEELEAGIVAPMKTHGQRENSNRLELIRNLSNPKIKSLIPEYLTVSSIGFHGGKDLSFREVVAGNKKLSSHIKMLQNGKTISPDDLMHIINDIKESRVGASNLYQNQLLSVIHTKRLDLAQHMGVSVEALCIEKYIRFHSKSFASWVEVHQKVVNMEKSLNAGRLTQEEVQDTIREVGETRGTIGTEIGPYLYGLPTEVIQAVNQDIYSFVPLVSKHFDVPEESVSLADLILHDHWVEKISSFAKLNKWKEKVRNSEIESEDMSHMMSDLGSIKYADLSNPDVLEAKETIKRWIAEYYNCSPEKVSLGLCASSGDSSKDIEVFTGSIYQKGDNQECEWSNLKVVRDITVKEGASLHCPSLEVILRNITLLDPGSIDLRSLKEVYGSVDIESKNENEDHTRFDIIKRAKMNTDAKNSTTISQQVASEDTSGIGK